MRPCAAKEKPVIYVIGQADGMWSVVQTDNQGRFVAEIKFFGDNAEAQAKEYLAWKQGSPPCQPPTA
jgi:hypothetical protein